MGTNRESCTIAAPVTLDWSGFGIAWVNLDARPKGTRKQGPGIKCGRGWQGIKKPQGEGCTRAKSASAKKGTKAKVAKATKKPSPVAVSDNKKYEQLQNEARLRWKKEGSDVLLSVGKTVIKSPDGNGTVIASTTMMQSPEKVRKGAIVADESNQISSHFGVPFDRVAIVSPDVNSSDPSAGPIAYRLGRFTRSEDQYRALDAIAAHPPIKDGIVSVSMGTDKKPLKPHPAFAQWNEKSMYGDEYNAIAIAEKGVLRPPTERELNKAHARQKIQELRSAQFQSGVGGVFEFGFSGVANQKQILGKALTSRYKKEEELARQIEKFDNQTEGRKPTKSLADINTKVMGDYHRRAKAWSKAQGFDGGGANGFSARQTFAHDIVHPATHDLIGKDSKQIHKAFGGFKRKDGANSLIAEEAIVNAVEHLSRGDDINSSVISGLRLARVLSRDKATTQEERDFIRTPEFAAKVKAEIERAYQHDNLHHILGVVRIKNRVADTVMTSGSNLTRVSKIAPNKTVKQQNLEFDNPSYYGGDYDVSIQDIDDLDTLFSKALSV